METSCSSCQFSGRKFYREGGKAVVTGIATGPTFVSGTRIRRPSRFGKGMICRVNLGLLQPDLYYTSWLQPRSQRGVLARKLGFFKRQKRSGISE